MIFSIVAALFIFFFVLPLAIIVLVRVVIPLIAVGGMLFGLWLLAGWLWEEVIFEERFIAAVTVLGGAAAIVAVVALLSRWANTPAAAPQAPVGRIEPTLTRKGH